MKSLEALENIKHYDSRVGLHEEDYELIEKSLKALEIIKEFCIVADYKTDDIYTRYELAFCKKICITKEEYDLLKEILDERLN